MSDFAQFLGRFHPLLVHLPIGILVVALLLFLRDLRRPSEGMRGVISVTLLLSALGAIISCVTGWLLSGSGEYEEGLMQRHKWFGIALAVFTTALYFGYTKALRFIRKPLIAYGFSFGLLLLLAVTGHLGGSLTHGEDFLAFEPAKPAEKEKVITDVQAALAYEELVQPVLEAKCYSCHGPRKQKGGLRLDALKEMLEGGEEGPALVAGDPGKSALYSRLLLDPEDEKHMPPKGKRQLTRQEIDLLHWWISQGAPEKKKVAELGQPGQATQVLRSFETKASAESASDLPSGEVSPADEQLLQPLRDRKIVVLPVHKGSAYLSVNFLSSSSLDDSTLRLLEPIAKQLVWLKIGNTSVTDAGMATIAKLSNLTRLSLEHTAVSDAGISRLVTLKQLRYLNLVGTRVTMASATTFSSMPELKSLYLHGSRISGEQVAALQKKLPKVAIDSGGYRLRFLASDTVELKPALR